MGEAGVHLGMTMEVVFETFGYVFALGDELDVGWAVETDLVEEERVVGTAKDDGVDEGIHVEEFVYSVFDEIVGSWFVEFVVLYEGYPHWAS